MIKDQGERNEDVDVMSVNPFINFGTIHIEEDNVEGASARCLNCGRERPITKMCYGNLSMVKKEYLCWSCYGRPYIHCMGGIGCPKDGCIRLWEDMVFLNDMINLHDTYTTGVECVSFSGSEICNKRLKELLDSGGVFQCRKCGSYFTRDLTAEAYMNAFEVDDVCASCYHEEVTAAEGEKGRIQPG